MGEEEKKQIFRFSWIGGKMTIQGSTYITKALEAYEKQFDVHHKNQKETIKKSRHEDEVVLSIEGKRKQLLEEMVLEVLGQLSTNVFENEAK